MPAVSSLIAGGAAILGAGSSIISGNKAANAQRDAAQQSAEIQRYMFDQSRADQAPYRDVGREALYKLADMYGVKREPTTDWAAYARANPDVIDYYKSHDGVNLFADNRDPMSLAEYGQAHYERYGSPQGRDLSPYQSETSGVGEYGGFMESPGYKFRLNEGIKAVERSAAARGLLGSGGTMKGIQRYGEGLASAEYENYANALRSMAGIGQTSAQTTGAQGIATGQGIAQAMTNAGNARASSFANTGAAINNGINNVMGAYLMGGFDKNNNNISSVPPWMTPGGGIGGGQPGARVPQFGYGNIT